MSTSLVHEDVWTERPVYEAAEQKYYEHLNKEVTLTPLADEVAKARQRLSEIRENFEPNPDISLPTVDTGAVKFLEKKVLEFQQVITEISDKLTKVEGRLQSIEDRLASAKPATTHAIQLDAAVKVEDADEDVDLFGSESEEENEEAERIREERLAAYHAKKSTKPVLIAKSSIILDVKPWDDETDMKAMEEEVRKVQMDGLLWGASKLVPQAYGIHKLQINCVIEDDKVSVDLLQEEIEKIEDLVQSVDIAAFNKI